MGASQDLGVRLGFAGGIAVTTVDEARSHAVWAAEVGFDSYWLSYLAGVDPLVALPAIAADAPGIELGTSVVPIVGRHPIVMAQLARTAQQLCGGRLTLGIGTAHQDVVEQRYGATWDRPLQRTREYLDLLLPLCQGEAAEASGQQVSGNMALDIPADPVPVIVAALGPKMLTLAGQRTAGTHVGQCGPKTLAEHTVPTINRAADEAGRPPPRVIALVNLCVGDPSTVHEAAAPIAAMYGAWPSYRAMLDLEGVADPTELILAGSIRDIATELRRYADAGVTDLRLGIAAPDQAHRQATLDALADWMA